MSSPTGSVAEQLRDDGYCTRPVLPAHVVAALRERFEDLAVPATEPDMYRAFADESRADARVLDHELKELIVPYVEQVLPGHHVVLATFIHKGPGGEPLDFHQDWTFTDERSHRAILFWVPLLDVDDHNGALAVVAGSHRWTDGLRTSSAEGSGTTEAYQDILSRRATTMCLEAGHGVIYDAAVIHGSRANGSAGGRTALALVTLPEGAPVVHFHQEPDGQVAGYLVDDDFFTTTEFEAHPRGYPPIEPWTGPVQAADLAPHLEPAPEPEPESGPESGPESEPERPAAPGRWRTRLRARLRADA
ncbi:MAG: hypothetical protein JWM47_3795 [Acidimicrobiales bacterium]|nr:hypothetical protein [Acidimicrobiales bacterium]